nr:HNH endonuclease [Deinococcus humi]
MEIGKLCWWCRQPLDDRDIHRDHVIPITKGGGGGENIVFSCATCNKKKTDKMPQEWLGISDFLGEPVGIGDLFEVLPDPTHHAGAEE